MIELRRRTLELAIDRLWYALADDAPRENTLAVRAALAGVVRAAVALAWARAVQDEPGK